MAVRVKRGYTTKALWDEEWFIRGITTKTEERSERIRIRKARCTWNPTWSGADDRQPGEKGESHGQLDKILLPYGIQLNAPSITVP